MDFFIKKVEMISLFAYIIDMNIDNFWKRVNTLIKTNKMSRKEFTESINIPYSTFRNWQYYSRSVELITAYTIATALGVSLEYLLTGKDKQNRAIKTKRNL